MNKKILLIAGTRPNFIKLAPLYHTLKRKKYNIKVCHTGQHYDKNMSDNFWQALQLPTPDFSLNIKGNSVPEIIGKTTTALGSLLIENQFDLVIVFGDVNATAAGAIASVQSHIPLMHVEAGLRSFDRTMPEEINRIITDHIADYLMVSESSGIKNLKNEGISDDKIFFVGNIMIEALLMTRKSWENISHTKEITKIISQKYAVATFHRPENVDNKDKLQKIISILNKMSETYNIILPLHPRTKKNLNKFDLSDKINTKNILLSEPLGYFTFLNLTSNAEVVLTDSGGIQEETSFLNIPCITFRNNTERPITIDLGTNLLMSVNEKDYNKKIIKHIDTIKSRKPEKIPFWDDNVSNRIEHNISYKIR